MERVFLMLGGNIGNRYAYLTNACELINKKLGQIIQCSDFFESESWGYEDELVYLNRAVVIETQHDPEELLFRIHKIETQLGRVRNTTHYQARTIDIDILFYGDKIHHTPSLIIPHPLLHQRRFVLEPLMQIAPDFIHPIFQKSILDLGSNCEDSGNVHLYKMEQSYLEV